MNKAQLELSIEVSSALILVSMFQNNICLNAADKRFDTIESGLNMMVTFACSAATWVPARKQSTP